MQTCTWQRFPFAPLHSSSRAIQGGSSSEASRAALNCIGAKGGTRTPTSLQTQEPESGVKSIDNNKLQQITTRNNKKRLYLREALAASECGVLLAKTVVC